MNDSIPPPSPRPKRVRRILGLALPIIMAQASQNLVNLIDTALVGQLGNAALAGAGLGGFACYALQALPLGLAVGVQALVARRKGEGALQEMAHPLRAGLLLSLVVGALLTAALYPLAPALCSAMSNDPEVARQGTRYLQMRLLGTVFISMSYCLGGFWNAIERPRIYLGILLGVHLSNVLISYALIFGKWGLPSLGIMGAGLGTSVSWLLGTLVALPLMAAQTRPHGGLCSPLRWKKLATLIQISLPNGIQQLSLSSGLTVFYWIVGLSGTRELAATHVLVNILMIALLLGLGFGMANATLVGQALGRKDAEDATRWGWQGMVSCFMLVALITPSPAALWAGLALPIYPRPHHPGAGRDSLYSHRFDRRYRRGGTIHHVRFPRSWRYRGSDEDLHDHAMGPLAPLGLRDGAAAWSGITWNLGVVYPLPTLTGLCL